MTVIENPVIEETHQATIDPMFDNDHFICCETPDGFVGMTTTFCGKEIFEDNPEAVTSVGCKACMDAIAKISCPIGKPCVVLLGQVPKP